MSEIRLIVAGGRDFSNYAQLKSILDRFVKKHNDSEIVIISGNARGADSLGERYAAETEIRVEKYPADWGQHGKKAGFIRNAEMAKVADVLIAFWDGQSRGTKHMIEQMRKLQKSVYVFDYDGYYIKDAVS